MGACEGTGAYDDQGPNQRCGEPKSTVAVTGQRLDSYDGTLTLGLATALGLRGSLFHPTRTCLK